MVDQSGITRRSGMRLKHACQADLPLASHQPGWDVSRRNIEPAAELISIETWESAGQMDVVCLRAPSWGWCGLDTSLEELSLLSLSRKIQSGVLLMAVPFM